MEVQFDFVLRTSAATKTEDPRLTWAITSDHPDCYSYPRAVTIEIYGAVQAQETYSPYLSRTMQSAEGLTLPCEYTYTFPENEDGPWARWERYQRVGTQPPYVHVPYTGANTVVRTPCAGDDVEWNEDRCDPPIRLFYRRAAISRFEPQIAISVPDEPADRYVGATFEVNFARVGSDASCTESDSATYVVQAGETEAQPMGDLPLLVYDPDTTDDNNALCSYTATFPEPFEVTHADATTTTLEASDSTTAAIADPTPVAVSYQQSSTPLPTTTTTEPPPTTTTTQPQPPSTTTTSTTSTSTSTTTTTTTQPQPPSTTTTMTSTTTTTEPPRTASTFAPMVSVSVPRLAGVSGDNIWATSEFEVTLERASGADHLCSLSWSVSVTFTVQPTGSVTPDASEMPASLVGETAFGVACEYTVTFPPAPHDTPGGDFDWTLTPATTTEVRLSHAPLAENSASHAYTVGAVTFAPDATITVPSGSDGATFDVDFTSAQPNCSGNQAPETLAYTVPTGGTTAQPNTATNPRLVAYPQGATASTAVCAYTVTFPPNENGAATALMLETINPPPDTEATGIAQAISATYVPALKGISSGETFSCALASDGAVFCWGDDGFDQLTVPAGPFTQVSTGASHACARRADGTAACWGDNVHGQTDVPALAQGATFTQVSAGWQHSCGLTSDGDVECWGNDSFGQATAPDLMPGVTYTQVSAGQFHSCAVKSDRSVACWGETFFSELLADTPMDRSFTSVSVGSFFACGVKTDDSAACWGNDAHGRATVPAGSFVSVSAGTNHACGVRSGGASDGAVVCWGSNDHNQRTAPSGPFATASAGTSHSCGLKTDGSVACWGYGNFGQADAPSGAFASVAGGQYHSCGIKTDNTSECWGANGSMQGTLPTLDAGVSFTQLSAGALHTCGLKNDDTLACWGNDGAGSTAGRVTNAPSAATDLFSSVTVGDGHSCGLRSGGATDGHIVCWGNNLERQLDSPSLGANETFTAVGAGAEHSCALKSDMSVVCWGYNGFRSGDGRVSGAPREATDLFSHLSVGDGHACAVLAADGTVACWGNNEHGQSTDPTGAFSAVAAGAKHTCAIRSGGTAGGAAAGTVVCWGSNDAGQSDAPDLTFASLTAGRFHTCGIRADDATGGAAGDNVVCWGAGTAWQLIRSGSTSDSGNGGSQSGDGTSGTSIPRQDTWNARVEIYTSFRDIDGDGNNDYNPQFTVTLTRTAGAAATCPSPITLRPRIGSAGADGSNGNQIIAGATHTADDLTQDCEYSVGWDSSGVLTGVTGDDGSEVDLSRIGGDNRISAGDPVANRIFRDKSLGGPGTLTFNPPLTAAPAGTMFEVRYVATSASPAACRLPAERDSETYTIGANGVPAETASEKWVAFNNFNFGLLLNRPAHGGGDCRYTLDLPDIEGYTKPANPPTVTSTGNVTVSYSAVGAQNFQPSLAFTVPMIDVDGTAGRDFVGATFRVTYSRSGGPDMGCTPSTTSYTWTLDSSGAVQPPADNDVVDVPAGLDPPVSCEYTVNFPQNASQGYTRAGNPQDNTISAADNAAAATYETRSTTFDATFAITGPTPVEHPAHGEGIRMSPARGRTVSWSYARQTSASMHCSADAAVNLSEQFRAQGTISTDVTGLVDLPRGYTTLADRCVYDITWNEEVPAIANADLSFTPFALHDILLAGTPAASTTFSGSMPSPTATYELANSTFEPNIDITVSSVDGLTAGENLFAGTTFDVNFTRVTGSHEDCSAETTVTATYTVQTNGDVTGTPPTLVDLPARHSARCVYDVSTPISKTSVTDAALTWALTRAAGATTSVNGGAIAVDADYTVGKVTFTPDVTIAVPPYDRDGQKGTNLFTGSTFRVSFTRSAGPASGCSALTETYVVAANGSVAPQDGVEPSLVHLPSASATTECVYDVGLPASRSSATNAELRWTLTREPGATTSANGGAADVSASYTVGAIEFTPDVRVTVPQIDGTTANMNAFAGATFNVRYVKKSGVGPATGCSAITEQTATYTVVDAGTVTGSVPTLTYRPAGVESSCEYEVTFPSSVRSPVMAALSWTLTGPSEPLSLRPGYGPVSGAYTVGAVTFTPAVAIEVPQYNGDGAQSSQNAFTGRTLEVNFVRSAGPLTGCVAVSETYEVSATGAVTAQDGSDPSLVHVPSGDAPSDCVYQVTYQHPVGADPALQRQATGLDATTRATDAATAAVYRAAQTSFVPTIAISVPPVEGLTTSENLFAGTTFDVGFTRVASSHAHCSAATQMNVTYTVQTNGTVTGVAPSLVDRPAGEHTRCVYDVSFPSSRPSASNAELEWTLTRAAGATASTHGGAAEVSASYTVGVVTFTPDVTIDVPQYNGEAAQSSQNAFTGRTLDVSFARSGGPTSGCATANEIYEVTATGAVVAQDGVEPQLTHFPDGDTSAGCVYAVTYPTRVGADPALERQAAGLDVVTLASDTTTAATYQAAASMFSPSIPISVPQIEGLTAGENVFAGATIDVSFRRASGAHRECSAATALTVTYTVAANGTVTGTPPSLVDRPAGEVDRCEYDVTFEQRVSSQDDAALGWTLTRGVATSSVNGGSSTARCNYEVGPITFTPTVDIDAPQYNGDGAQSGQNAFTGRTFGVTFARSGGPARGCVGASEPYIVDADGSVVPRDGTPPSLVHLPAGETSGGCVYSVSYAPTAGSDPPLRRQASGLDATTQASDTATSATYHADETSFSPTVPIEVPDVDGLTANENLFAGTTIGVSFQRAAGSHTDCSAATPMSVPYTVQADGRVTGTPPRLVDRPAGQAGRCDYDVRFDEQASAARDAPLDWDLTRQVAGRSVHGGSSSVPCEYGVGDVSFSPQVDIEVPPHKGDGEQATQSAFTGQTLDVSFTPADASQRGCSSLTKRYVVRPDGSVVPEDGREPSLAHFPDGDMSSECTYNVEYHAGSGGSEALGDHVGESDMQTHARDTATTVTYQAAETSFTPTIVITVPQVDGLTQDENLFADTAFDVGFTQVTGSHEDCSAPTATTVTYAVQANGSVTGTPPRLVDRPAGETARCVYDVTTTPSRASANGAALRWTLTRAAGATTSTHGGRDVVRAHYDVGPVTFTPAVAIAVPQYNGDVAQVSQNAFTGRTFEVTFARSAGATTGCASASETYVIASDGTVAPQDGSDPSLVHLPYAQAQTGCVYSVTYPARSGTGPALERQVTDLDASTQATDTATAATYHAAETSFTPAIEIAVPPLEGMTEGKNLFAGTSLAVSFTKASGAHDDCDAASAAAVPYVVQVNGSVTGTPPSLVDRPSGQATRCSYDLSFDASATSVAGAELGWRLTRGAVTASVTGGAAAGTATYAAGDVTYLPETMIAVPQYNGDGAQAEQNAFAGEEIAVSFSSTSDDCENATLTFVVQATGEVSPESAPTRLVAYPSGSEVLCSYDVAFARNETAGTRLVLQPDSSNSVSGVRQTIRARYRAAASTFAPAVAINVPYVDVDSDGANDLATQTVTVNYVPFGALEQNDDCTPDATETYTVGDGGTAAEGGQLTRTTSAASLVDRPAGESVRCRYVADFTDSVSDGALATFDLAADARQFTNSVPVTVTYSGDTFFVVDATIAVPRYDRDGSAAVNFYEGAALDISFSQKAGTGQVSGCSESTTVKYVVQIDGSVLPDGGPPALVNVPDGQTDSCTYVAAFADAVTSAPGASPAWTLNRLSTQPATTDVSAAAASISRNYEAEAITFEPTVELSVPYVDGLTVGESAFAGTTFEVGFTREPGVHPDCSAATAETATYAVQANGVVTGTPPSLVDRPAGESERCAYDVTTPASRSAANDATLGWTLSRLAALTSVSGDTTAAAHYEVGDVTFTPAVTIEVPQYNGDGARSTENAFTGRTFTVRFSPVVDAETTCATVTETYAVASDGSVGPMDGTPPSLVHVPANDSTSECHYEVTYPTSAGDAPALNLQASARDVTTRARDVAASATYEASETTFVPSVTITVPTIDGLVANKSLFASARFDVRFTQAADARVDCSAVTPVSVTYTVENDGAVAGKPPTLVDRPAGETTRCAYDVAVESSKLSSAGAQLTWELTRGASTASVNGGALEASASYTVGDVTYVPDASISVPQYNGDGAQSTQNAFTGERLSVSFTSATNGCDDATLTFVVRANGSVTLETTATDLIAYPDGSTDLCAYTVAFPPNEVGGTRLALAAGSSTSVTATAQAIRARYAAGATTFQPTVSVAVPFADADGDGNNDFASETIEVSYAPVAGLAQHSGCTPSATETYTIGNGGSASAGGRLSLTSSPASLVDRPAGETRRCRYAADFDDSVSHSASTAADLAADRREFTSEVPVKATYSQDKYFTATLDIDVPDYDRDGRTSSNYFEGAIFGVVFTKKQNIGPATGCSEPTRIRYVVLHDGSVAPDGGAPALIDEPDGGTGRCVYETTFPTALRSTPRATQRWTLRNQGSSVSDIQAASGSVGRTYLADATVFAPTVAIAVPRVDGLTAGANLFADTTFDVDFVRTAGSHDDCSARTTVSVTYTAQAAAAVTGAPPVLVDRPAKQVGRCSYEVATPATRRSASGAALRWALTRDAGATESVDGERSTITADYSVGAVTFTPAVDIEVPQYNGDGLASARNAFAGRTLDVTFGRSAGPGTGCSAVTERYVVAVDGSVAPQDGTAPSLIHRPATEAIDHCEYTVTYPATSGAVPSLNRQSAGLDVTSRAIDAATSVTYHASQTTFDPTATITVPPVAGLTVGENLFADTEFEVRLERTTSAHPDCSAVAATSSTFVVQTAGSVLGTLPAALVDRPAGQTARCPYAVAMPPTVESPESSALGWVLSLDEGATSSLDGGSLAVTAAYTVGAVTFTPAVNITVPQVAGVGAQAEQNLYEGRTFEVSFTRSAGPAEGCLSVSQTYVVTAVGSVVPLDEIEPVLVHLPAGETSNHCVYRVTYPINSGAGPQLARQSAGLDITTRASEPATAAAYQVVTPQSASVGRGAARGGSSRGGGGRSGGGSIGPWQLVASSRAPVSVSLSVPEDGIAVGAPIEMMLNVPGTCGDDLTAFDGLAAEIGLVYALSVETGATVDVIANARLRLVGYAERGTQQRPCVLRVTLVAAPTDCRLEDASTDDDGRSYVEAAWSDDAQTFNLSPALVCDVGEVEGAAAAAAARASLW